MSKVLIAKIEDINKIDNEIDRYMFETGETDPYLFMSKKTFAAITHVSYDFCIGQKTIADGIIGKYHGYKIYPNNELGLGEVEIR